MALYVLIAVALNAALTLLDGDCRFSDGLACISSGSTLLRAARKLGSVPVVPHGTPVKRRGLIRNSTAGYSYDNDFLKQKLATNLSRAAVAVRTCNHTNHRFSSAATRRGGDILVIDVLAFLVIDRWRY